MRNVQDNEGGIMGKCFSEFWFPLIQGWDVQDNEGGIMGKCFSEFWFPLIQGWVQYKQ